MSKLLGSIQMKFLSKTDHLMVYLLRPTLRALIKQKGQILQEWPKILKDWGQYMIEL